MKHCLEELVALRLSQTALDIFCHLHKLQLHGLHLAAGDKLGCLKLPETESILSFCIS